MISGYVWILPAVTIAGWIASWWGPHWIRWTLLSASAVVSVLCVATGDAEKGSPATPVGTGCSPPLACMDWHPVYWLEAGLFGLVCCAVLLIPTIAAEAVVWFEGRGFRGSPG
ncbi:hypothetical protein OG223_33810 [Streptomyces sp. NBC_01478]|uniref:hypothetical protein n=1 Tax=Streptomyces sp. NBC_01478 TaxID=2903882 RepID=UPI002E3457CC|nr:hypothetical protein [Streptomyces sp. NBC_01478]